MKLKKLVENSIPYQIKQKRQNNQEKEADYEDTYIADAFWLQNHSLCWGYGLLTVGPVIKPGTYAIAIDSTLSIVQTVIRVSPQTTQIRLNYRLIWCLLSQDV